MAGPCQLHPRRRLLLLLLLQVWPPWEAGPVENKLPDFRGI